ncbi:MAG: DUF3488 domain-containing protein [Candidatus Competibacter sp.]
MTPLALTWLLVALALAVAPHARELSVWLTVLFVAILGWRWFLARRGQPLPARWLLLPVAVLAGAGVLIDYRTLFGRDAGVALLTAMTACKLLETRELRDGVVLVFLGYLLVMSNLLYSQEIPMIAYLFAVVLLMLAAQVMIHRQHAGLGALAPLRLSGKMALQAVPVMVILFVLFPRIPGPLWGLPKDAYKGRTGLSEEMMPGSVSELSKSDAVAFRARFAGLTPPPNRLYWRGPVLWNFDGRRWTSGDGRPANVPIPFAPEGAAVEYSVILEPSNRIWLFALDLPALLPPRAAMTPSFLLLRDQPVNEVYRYDMRSYPTYRTGDLTEAEKTRALRLPPRGNPRARTLAAEWRERDARPEALVNAALLLFREQAFYYTLTPPLLNVDSVDDFLFRTRQWLLRALHQRVRVSDAGGGSAGAGGDRLSGRGAQHLRRLPHRPAVRRPRLGRGLVGRAGVDAGRPDGGGGAEPDPRRAVCRRGRSRCAAVPGPARRRQRMAAATGDELGFPEQFLERMGLGLRPRPAEGVFIGPRLRSGGLGRHDGGDDGGVGRVRLCWSPDSGGEAIFHATRWPAPICGSAPGSPDAGWRATPRKDRWRSPSGWPSAGRRSRCRFEKSANSTRNCATVRPSRPIEVRQLWRLVRRFRA